MVYYPDTFFGCCICRADPSAKHLRQIGYQHLDILTEIVILQRGITEDSTITEFLQLIVKACQNIGTIRIDRDLGTLCLVPYVQMADPTRSRTYM